MRYGSICSGIEAATAAWHPLGWQPAFFSEIAAFPRAVLKHHYPSVPLHGDFTTIQKDDYGAIDLLVGGTPCQSFSLAGLRGGLGDDRGNLALEFLRLADRKRPEWLVWENVAGVLSSNGGRDFGSILGGMVQLGYGVAYRILDTQFVRVDGFGRAIPQRRRRVFVVGYLGDWRRAAAVLFERESLSGNSPPRRGAGQGLAADVAPSLVSSGRGVERTGETRGQDPVVAVPVVANPLTARMHKGINTTADEGQTMIVSPIASTLPAGKNATGGDRPPGMGPETAAGYLVAKPICFDARQSDVVIYGGESGPLDTCAYSQAVALSSWAVRRLTPIECERLQGFRDNFTLVPYRGKLAADGPRYSSLGNSMSVNVMRWIGQRIDLVNASMQEQKPLRRLTGGASLTPCV